MEYEFYRDSREYFKVGENCCKEHFHRAIEIQYCIKEIKRIFIDGKESYLPEGEVLFVPPFTTHRFPRQNGHISLGVVFPVSYTDKWESYVNGKQFDSLVFTDKNFCKDIYVHLMKLEESQNPLVRDAIYTYILGMLLENGSLVVKDQKRSDSFAVQVLTYIEKHYSEDLTLKKISDALGYNYSYFSTLFKNVFHSSFCEYLAMLRVRKSLPLLEKQPINSVAFAVGFGSLQSYYTNFKKVIGTTPAEYVRNKNK